jgi:type II secretory pathway pseudopilin PulG
MNTRKKIRSSGVLLVEVIVAITVLGTIILALALSLHAFGKFNKYQLVRQQCIAAAEAQLDSITATGKSVSDKELTVLWPKVTVDVERIQGTDRWKFAELIRVTAKAKAGRKDVIVELSRYVIPKQTVVAGE